MAHEHLAWERQAGESSQAFAAFCVYRDLGPHRSLDKAYRKHKPDAEKFSGQWSDWSAQWRWLDRALAYDDHCDGERRKIRERRLRDLEARRVEFEIRGQEALEKWVEELDGELRAALTEGYTESEEKFESVTDNESGEKKLVPVRRLTKVKFPSLSAFARLLKERNETFRIAVEGPRQNQLKPDPSAETPAAGGGEFVWVRPEGPPDENEG